MNLLVDTEEIEPIQYMQQRHSGLSRSSKLNFGKKTNKMSLVKIFLSEFKGKELIKTIINLIFVYLMTTYAMSEGHSLLTFIILGLILLNVQKALEKFVSKAPL